MKPSEFPQHIKRMLRRFGAEVSRFDYKLPIVRRMQLLSHHGIDLVLDIGANVGQFGMELRDLGYRGDMISFEPLSSAFEELSRITVGDSEWTVRNEALGDSDTVMAINIAENSVSSSLKPMRERHLRAAPTSGYIGQEMVTVRRLDSIFGAIGADGKAVFCKIDAQGSERQVLDGAGDKLNALELIYVETALVSLYEDDCLLEDMLRYMRQRNFFPVHVEQGFFDRYTGHSYQVDLVFARDR